jgi:hypothetical protein
MYTQLKQGSKTIALAKVNDMRSSPFDRLQPRSGLVIRIRCDCINLEFSRHPEPELIKDIQDHIEGRYGFSFFSPCLSIWWFIFPLNYDRLEVANALKEICEEHISTELIPYSGSIASAKSTNSAIGGKKVKPITVKNEVVVNDNIRTKPAPRTYSFEDAGESWIEYDGRKWAMNGFAALSEECIPYGIKFNGHWYSAESSASANSIGFTAHILPTVLYPYEERKQEMQPHDGWFDNRFLPFLGHVKAVSHPWDRDYLPNPYGAYLVQNDQVLAYIMPVHALDLQGDFKSRFFQFNQV